jgi:hypothetical protein
MRSDERGETTYLGRGALANIVMATSNFADTPEPYT